MLGKAVSATRLPLQQTKPIRAFCSLEGGGEGEGGMAEKPLWNRPHKAKPSWLKARKAMPTEEKSHGAELEKTGGRAEKV